MERDAREHLRLGVLPAPDRGSERAPAPAPQRRRASIEHSRERSAASFAANLTAADRHNSAATATPPV
ncbi:MAG TPA: hypothetical protein VN772_07605 [Solirubrobacteraceae bacterium]|nr:hypothetical protein [Solirubrobacteraceae bacterium]